MTTSAPARSISMTMLGLGTLAFAAAAGLGFALWMEKAPAIFMAMVEAGIAWCL